MLCMRRGASLGATQHLSAKRTRQGIKEKRVVRFMYEGDCFSHINVAAFLRRSGTLRLRYLMWTGYRSFAKNPIDKICEL